jgi:hypothetical protein
MVAATNKDNETEVQAVNIYSYRLVTWQRYRQSISILIALLSDRGTGSQYLFLSPCYLTEVQMVNFYSLLITWHFNFMNWYSYGFYTVITWKYFCRMEIPRKRNPLPLQRMLTMELLRNLSLFFTLSMEAPTLMVCLKPYRKYSPDTSFCTMRTCSLSES